jgi:hypothetical protein
MRQTLTKKFTKLGVISLVTLLGAVGCSSTPKATEVSETENTDTNTETVQVQDLDRAAEPSVIQKTAQTDKPAPPIVINPRATPEVVTLSEDLQVSRPLEVYADVKNLGSDVDDVKLRVYFAPDTDARLKFFNKPVEVSMEHMVGSTWKAELSADELKRLAINGESLRYVGQVIAENDEGQTTVSSVPIQFTVQAPIATDLKG